MKRNWLSVLVGIIFTLTYATSAKAFSFGTVISLKGDVSSSIDGKKWIPLREGEELSKFAALKVRDKSFLKIILSDNSLVSLDEDSMVSLSFRENYTKLVVGRGRVRLLSYKNEKVIQTPQRTFSLYKGEYLIDVFKQNSLLKTDLTAYSGHVFFKGEPVIPKEYAKRPKLEFPKRRENASYDIAIKPPVEKTPSRGIASVEEDASVEEIRESLNADFEVDQEKGEIWVHDIVYDEAVRVIESFVFKEVDRLVPIAVEEASKNLVWDVAEKSIKRWGVYYANKGINGEVPLVVNRAYQYETGKEEGDFSHKNILSYEYSTGKVAEIRTYRRAKVLVETKGYEKSWQETKGYIEKMLPEVVAPLIVKEVYTKVLPIARKAVDKVMKKSELVPSKDVDKLIRHISRVTCEIITKNAIHKYGNLYATRDAKLIVGQLSRGVSHDIANYMAIKAKKRASNVITTLFARQRARGIASEVVEESNQEIYEEMRKKQRERLFRAHR